jgi:hypothetical protein
MNTNNYLKVTGNHTITGSFHFFDGTSQESARAAYDAATTECYEFNASLPAGTSAKARLSIWEECRHLPRSLRVIGATPEDWDGEHRPSSDPLAIVPWKTGRKMVPSTLRGKEVR